MGPAGTILAAKAVSGVDVDRVMEAFDFGPPEAGDDGWFISQARRSDDPAQEYFDALVDALGGPTIIVKVFANDWAYLIASVPGSEPIAIVLTPDAVRAEIGPQPWTAEGAAISHGCTWAASHRPGRHVSW